MNTKKAFCENCDDDMEFTIEDVEIHSTFKGVSFTYGFKRAYCKKCHEQVYPICLEKDNYISMTDGYKKAVGLLTSKEILQIRKELGMTQEQLAAQIGAGAKTITRYELGSIQDVAYDKLIRIFYKLNMSIKKVPENRITYSQNYVLSNSSFRTKKYFNNLNHNNKNRDEKITFRKGELQYA